MDDPGDARRRHRFAVIVVAALVAAGVALAVLTGRGAVFANFGPMDWAVSAVGLVLMLWALLRARQ